MDQSLVFRAMFAHESMQESREGRIRIEDSTPIAVEQMVHYLYQGELPEDYDTERDAIALAHLANKYDLQPLMKCNEKHLVER
jgi:hypothetical protein